MADKQQGTFAVKAGLAQMLKGGVIMDVTNVEEARIAEEAGAVAVMALERVPADIRRCALLCTAFYVTPDSLYLSLPCTQRVHSVRNGADHPNGGLRQSSLRRRRDEAPSRMAHLCAIVAPQVLVIIYSFAVGERRSLRNSRCQTF